MGVVVCVLILALQTYCGLGQFLPHLQLTGQGELAGVHTHCDDCSDGVNLTIPFPFGDYCHDQCYIGVNGVISFGQVFEVFTPELLPGTIALVRYAYLVAPFWADADLRESGNILWEVHSAGGSEIGDSYLDQVSVFIENRENVTFAGNWMMMVDYDQVPPYHAFADFLDLILPNNTFQVILITDGRKSYAIYTYTCGEMEWGNSAIIGFNAAGTYYQNHEASGSITVATMIACLANQQEINNVVYDLVPQPSALQCSVPTPAPPTSLGTCQGAGYDTCCISGSFDICFGLPQDCFCDPTCRLYNDCCRDIDDICPTGNFTIGNDSYLLFANSFHINRVTLDGSSFEILYTDPSSGGIVGLDYHHSQDMMYWSDVRTGSLHRAFLNGSNAEVLFYTDDPVVDDIAVDWVNNKLYWTEATLGKVLVMDLETRQITTLIVNYDSATTRAIAVDPTTRYMYWSDWGTEARIERAGMDGSNRTVLHNTNLVWPNGITLDLANQRIYWIDASIDTIEYSNVDGSGRTLLERVDDEIFHPFAITLENEFLFWTDWNQLAIFTTHKDLPNDNIISLYDVLVDSPHGIEAVTPDRQQNVANPCDSASCDAAFICLLSPSAPGGYSCVCTDDAENCTGPTPPPTPPPPPPPQEYGSCLAAGYSDCCVMGLCRGIMIPSWEPSLCTCDAICIELGTCCDDIILTCPEVRHSCGIAGHNECCPAGTGCKDSFGQCSCDADCFEHNTCCADALYLCQNATLPTRTIPTSSLSTPTISATASSSISMTPSITFHPSPTPTPILPPVVMVPGSVIEVQAVNVSSSALRISWLAPEDGDRVDLYRVTVTIGSGDIMAIREDKNLFVIIDGLEPEVPYYVTVEAVNSLGAGDASKTIAFTREGTPSVAPDLTVVWTSLTDLEVSWVPLTLEQARGFITSYVISYSSDTSRRKRQDGRETVAGDQSSVTLAGLDSDLKYSVSVAAVTAAGEGVASEPISAPSAGTLIQLHFLDLQNCDNLNDEMERRIVEQIVAWIVSRVNAKCTECDLTVGSITNGQLHAECDKDSHTFRAVLLGDDKKNDPIIETITELVKQGSNSTIGGMLLKLNSNCEVVIESLNEEFCSVQTPPTPPVTTEAVSTDDSNVANIVAPIVIIVLLVVAVIVALVVIVLFRRRKKQKSDPYLNFDDHRESSGTASLSHSFYTGDRRDYQNPIYGEQGRNEEEEEDEKKVPLEKEYLEDPTILK